MLKMSHPSLLSIRAFIVIALFCCGAAVESVRFLATQIHRRDREKKTSGKKRLRKNFMNKPKPETNINLGFSKKGPQSL